ncbi:ARM repeat-containing protein [Backusella circina FSU 941]|nr:ARM repeat-containing protein [Backusella circina FSU 941]
MTSVEPPSLVQIETEHLEIGRNDPQEDVRVTIVTHPYLDDTLESIRLQHFPWESKMEGRIVPSCGYERHFVGLETVLPSLKKLINVFKKSKNDGPQEIYEVTFVIWLLTFDKEIAVQLDRKYKIIPTLVELAKTAVKEKVSRIVIAIFKNLIERAPTENMQAMLVAKLLPLTEHLVTRKWSDEEISDDLEYIKTELQQNFQSLTTFEVYTSELDTGMLQWSPSHLSENFWKQNAGRLNDNNQNLLRKLARILSASTNPVVLAVACHDMGQYVKYNPIDGRKNLEIIGAKQRIMELMTHQDPDVKYNALSATQKYFSMAS